MLVREALEQRKSTRAYLPKPVERELIEQILEAARHAPSGVNSQPWQVAVVTGDTKLKLQQRVEAAFRSGKEKKMHYHYYPQPPRPVLSFRDATSYYRMMSKHWPNRPSRIVPY